MTADASISAPPDTPADSYGWDWSATTHEGSAGVVDDLAAALGTSLALPGRGLQGWSESVECFDSDGYSLAQIFWGGGRDDVHVLSTGESAARARYSAVGLAGARTARVDTRVDTLTSFDDLEAICWDAVESYGSQITKMESWKQRERAGRTIYLGAPSSAIRVRIYEKWLESPGQYVEGTNRVEVQLRPPSRAKERVSSWAPAKTFCASKTTTAIAEALGQEVAVAGSLHIRRPTPDLETSLQAMSDQYGGAVARWLENSGGDIARVVDYLVHKHNQIED